MAESTAVSNLLYSWIASRIGGASLGWLNDRSDAIASGDRKALFLAFGLVPRKVGKTDLKLTEVELVAAEDARPGWNPKGWSLDQLARTYLLLKFPSQELAAYSTTLESLFSTGEVGELVALYQALPVLPHQKGFVLQAAEGIRSNIKAVFCAVAHQNPFPSEQFNDDQWNQMVLKCLFIGVSLRPVVGLDERANARLMSMLVDFAHERRAAHRPIPAELWRCVGPFADERAIDDLQVVLKTGSPAEQQAAALSLSVSPHPRARSVLASMPDLANSIASGEFSWRAVSLAESSAS